MLLKNYTSRLEEGWYPVFTQKRSHHRAIEHALSLPMVLGRRTISRTICSLDRAHRDWSADYKLFSRSDWAQEELFAPVVSDYLERYPREPISTAFDDTKVAKRGKKIVGTSWQRDPMSPPFHVNFLYGLRFIQASLLVPCYRSGTVGARALPVRFENAPVLKKPGKRATEEQKRVHRHLKKQQNLSAQTLRVIESLRQQLDTQGAAERVLLSVVDGSFCNRTMFRAALDRVEVLWRVAVKMPGCVCPPRRGNAEKICCGNFYPRAGA